MSRWFYGCLVVAPLVLLSAYPVEAGLADAPGWVRLRVEVASAAYGQPGGRAKRPSGYDPAEATEEPDVRERRVGGRYPLEKELATDRSWDTWLYVFTALMVLCVGWLCFKPHRAPAGKRGGGFSVFRRRADSGKGKKARK